MGKPNVILQRRAANRTKFQEHLVWYIHFVVDPAVHRSHITITAPYLKISTTVTVPAALPGADPTLTPWYMALVHINLQGLKVGLAGFDEMIRP